MDASQPKKLSLRTLNVASAVLLGALIAGHAVALVWTSRAVRRASVSLERDVASVEATHQLERTVREYHRIGNAWLRTRDPGIRAARADLEPALRDLRTEVATFVVDDAERTLFDRFDASFAEYRSMRQTIEARHLPVEQVVMAVHPSFDRSLAAVAELRRVKESKRRTSRATADRMLRLQNRVVLGSALLLLLGLAVVASGIHRLILRPILNLQEAVRQFRSGAPGVQVSGGVLAETHELADRFNEMTASIGEQRQDQLTFLAAVAHDLRNPLSALKLIVQTLERDPALATPDRFRRLDRQLDRLTRMVGDLLDATRIESGHLELALEEFDLRTVAQSMVDLYGPTTTHRLTLTAPERPLFVRGDPLRLEQVVGNLLSNAIKYSPAGGPVDVVLAAAGADATLSVSDRGPGIAREELPALFLPFRRRPANASIRGVGLGLSIVRRIVDAHGGRIEVESEPNAGSTFRVRLPLAVRAGRETEVRPAPEESAHP